MPSLFALTVAGGVAEALPVRDRRWRWHSAARCLRSRPAPRRALVPRRQQEAPSYRPGQARHPDERPADGSYSRCSVSGSFRCAGKLGIQPKQKRHGISRESPDLLCGYRTSSSRTSSVTSSTKMTRS